jgi:transposase InsO family protein
MTNSEQRRLTNWRLKVLQAATHAGNVARTCRHFGLSRKTFYKWRQRYHQHGDIGLADRARAPHHCTRIRVLKVYDACNQRTAIEFIDKVLRRLPFRVHVIQTDNGAEFQSHFHWHLEARDIRHVYIRPRTPHLNGKVERSHRVDDQEFYQLLDKDGISDDIHLFNAKLKEWEDYYNYHRPHGALAGQTPYERLLAKARAGMSPAS